MTVYTLEMKGTILKNTMTLFAAEEQNQNYFILSENKRITI